MLLTQLCIFCAIYMTINPWPVLLKGVSVFSYLEKLGKIKLANRIFLNFAGLLRMEIKKNRKNGGP